MIHLSKTAIIIYIKEIYALVLANAVNSNEYLHFNSAATIIHYGLLINWRNESVGGTTFLERGVIFVKVEIGNLQVMKI